MIVCLASPLALRRQTYRSRRWRSQLIGGRDYDPRTAAERASASRRSGYAGYQCGETCRSVIDLSPHARNNYADDARCVVREYRPDIVH